MQSKHDNVISWLLREKNHNGIGYVVERDVKTGEYQLVIENNSHKCRAKIISARKYMIGGTIDIKFNLEGKSAELFLPGPKIKAIEPTVQYEGENLILLNYIHRDKEKGP